MTDPAELAKGLDLSTDNLRRQLFLMNTGEALIARAAIRWALDQLASTMSAEEVREAALDFIEQVQTELLSQDEILLKFNLDKLGRLLELLAPAPTAPTPSTPESDATKVRPAPIA